MTALLRPERWRLAVVAACTVLSAGFLLIGPALLGRATDILLAGVVGARLRPGESKAEAVAGLRADGSGHLADMLALMDVHPGAGVDLNRFGRALVLVAVVYLVGAVLSWAQARILTGIVQRTMYRLREATEGKLIRLPLRYFDTRPRGDLISRVVNDVDNVDTTLQESLSQLPTCLLTVLGTLGVMFWISPLLAGVSLVTIPVVVVVTVLIAGRSKAMYATQWDQTGQLTSVVEETCAGHDVVLAYGQRQAMAAEFGLRNDRLARAATRAQFLSGMVFAAVLFVGNLNYIAVAAFGGYQVVAGVVSLGAVQAFIQYSQRFAAPIIQIASQLNQLQSGLVSTGRVLEFLRAPEEPALPERVPPTPAAPDPGTGRVRLEQVGFRYEPDSPLIEDFTLEAAPGQTVAIVGPTGAGKTTVVNLLVRFYEVDSGRILLDGVDYRELGRDQVRRGFGMVLQDAWLFHGTIRDNIAYGREGARDEEILAAARAAHVDEFVRALPDGYATVLEGDASNISVGQRQLITIARVFLADPSILILDEATSNVDSRTEAMIQAAMARLRAGRTSFVIAHQLSTVHTADTIVVMDAGRVVELGTHRQLMDRRGTYHDLYTVQFDSLAP